MSVEAIGAISQSGATPSQSSVGHQSQSVDATEISIKSNQASSSQPSGFVEKASSQVYETIDQLGVSLPGVEDSVSAAINKAKQDLSPASESISSGLKSVKPEGNEALVALSKTFDHAVFMAMVNQVISGVSDTSRTLMKQQ